MIGMILVMAWTGFVACYLVWQQLSGDLNGETSGTQAAASSYSATATRAELGVPAKS